jgi:hypothetical protein
MPNTLIGTIDDGAKQVILMLQSILTSFLVEHQIAMTVIIFLAVVFATLKDMMERWGMWGSVLYNALYFGALLKIGLMWGPDIFVSNFFNTACTIAPYLICYLVIGIILNGIAVLSGRIKRKR